VSQKPLDPALAAQALGALQVCGTKSEAARFLGLSLSTFKSRLVVAGIKGYAPAAVVDEREWRYTITLPHGHIVIGSDAHYMPGEPSTAHRAFVEIVKRLKPYAVIMNGDGLDGSAIGRHFRIRWHRPPTIKEELEVLQDRLGEIAKHAGAAKLIRTHGNHDSRFDTFLSANAPHFEGVFGFSLKDHLPAWQQCMSVWVNDDVVIKHRFKGGVHAAHNNTKDSGRTLVTGHLHSQKVSPWTDYNGTRYGVDCGTLADLYGEQFHYSEDDPRNWRSGFAVLTFVDGELMPPDLCSVLGPGHVYFRGEVICV
jgi:hypothetical protein